MSLIIPSPGPPNYLYEAEMVRILDGDTFDARVRTTPSVDYGFGIKSAGSFFQMRFRLRYLNTAEMGTTEGEVAKEWLTRRIDGKPFFLHSYRKDKWSRFLATIWKHDAINTTWAQSINKDMIDCGIAKIDNTEKLPID